MSKFYSELSPDLLRFIGEQKIFFTATAPAQGRVNLSPKGMDTLRCLDSKTVAYLDLTGSGNETAAHLLENSRMTMMFCSFSEEPLILRLYGQGQVIRPQHPDWAMLYPHFTPTPGERQVIVLKIQTVQTSCGYAVPVLEFKEERDQLKKWAQRKGVQGIAEYWRVKNRKSIDGLPTGIGG
ncbi:pyridoxamine 5'-phosphate oxidase family protein [Anthocerotibacter panamensis]|uniref:pyridoxamine 5'-phosphate oxidase family protein n=1 Tax=Anthocerotibacter panamensis TaxID=2857077 RepID=UPI001C4079CD|nr:pyridoxamine 5'-phosphate oxidase family protein [Anthocerotibacter panamensis]